MIHDIAKDGPVVIVRNIPGAHDLKSLKFQPGEEFSVTLTFPDGLEREELWRVTQRGGYATARAERLSEKFIRPVVVAHDVPAEAVKGNEGSDS